MSYYRKRHKTFSKIKRVTRDGVTYDSQLEANVGGYLELICDELIIGLHRQERTIIIPGNESFKAKVWVMDFMLNYHDQLIPIEVKGNWVNQSSEFKTNWNRKLHLLSHFQPELFERLIVFTDYEDKSKAYSTAQSYYELKDQVIKAIQWH